MVLDKDHGGGGGGDDDDGELGGGALGDAEREQPLSEAPRFVSPQRLRWPLLARDLYQRSHHVTNNPFQFPLGFLGSLWFMVCFEFVERKIYEIDRIGLGILLNLM